MSDNNKESLHDADGNEATHSDGLHESHESRHSDGLHEQRGKSAHSNANAEKAAEDTEKENEDEADAEAPPIDRRVFHHTGGVPNDYPGGNPGNADNDRLHQAHAERGGHVSENETDEQFLSKPHHHLPSNATGLSDDEDVDLVGPAVHGPNDVAPSAPAGDDDDEGDARDDEDKEDKEDK